MRMARTTKITVTTALLLLLFLATLLFVLSESQNAGAQTHTVGKAGADFTSIQEAVNASQSGDELLVAAGEYHEVVVVDRTLTITGAGPNDTIMITDLGEAAVTLAAPGVTLTGFGFQGEFAVEEDRENVGLVLEQHSCRLKNIRINGTDAGIIFTNGSRENLVENITIQHTRLGLYMNHSLENQVKNLKINDTSFTGIVLSASPGNIFTGSTMSFCGWNGLWLANSDNVSLIKCSFLENSGSGLYLFGCENFLLTNNTFTKAGVSLYYARNATIENSSFADTVTALRLTACENSSIQNNRFENISATGLYLSNSLNCSLENNRFLECGIHLASEGGKTEPWTSHKINASNLVNGKPILYRHSLQGGDISGDYGQVILGSSRNLTLRNLVIDNTTAGIQLGQCENITVLNSSLTNNYYGLWLDNSQDCLIRDSKFQKNSEGLAIYNSEGNVILFNFFQDNDCDLIQNNGRSPVDLHRVNEVHYNDFGQDGVAVEIRAGSLPLLNLTNNWWGHVSGPFSYISNLEGQGSGVLGSYTFSPWLMKPATGPQITGVHTIAEVDRPYRLHLGVLNMDSGALSWNLETDAGFLSLEGGQGILSGTPDTPGEFQVNLSVFDGELREYLNFTLVVLQPNQAPILFFYEPDPGVKSNLLELRGRVEDSGEVKRIEISFDGGEKWRYGETEADGSWSYILDTTIPGDGVHVITVRAFDGELYSLPVNRSIEVKNVLPSDPEEDEDEDSIPFALTAFVLALLFIMIGLMFFLFFGAPQGSRKQGSPMKKKGAPPMLRKKGAPPMLRKKGVPKMPLKKGTPPVTGRVAPGTWKTPPGQNKKKEEPPAVQESAPKSSIPKDQVIPEPTSLTAPSKFPGLKAPPKKEDSSHISQTPDLDNFSSLGSLDSFSSKLPQMPTTSQKDAGRETVKPGDQKQKRTMRARKK